MLAGKIVKGLEVSHFNLPNILRSKVTEGAEAGAKAVEQAAEKVTEKTAQTLEHMPTKQDLVIVPIKDRIVSAGPPHSPLNQSWGVKGFPEQIRNLSGLVEKKLSKYVKMIPENSKMAKPISFENNGKCSISRTNISNSQLQNLLLYNKRYLLIHHKY